MKNKSTLQSLETGCCLNGFTITRVTPLPELRLTAYEAVHEYSGARLLHLHCPEDAENLLAIGFRTPPADDCGTPHILEHSVLCGSRRFPVKDPFVEMIKMSMATFINAVTYPDRTIYPVASNVRQDFFNLAEVYVDAVFHPTLTPDTLKQEGHHLDFEEKGDPDTPLFIKGIVYNEMRGAYSDLDSVIDRNSCRDLFPDSIYGLDSGGDPEAIPDLNYDTFKTYYEDHYHPSNAYILTYGDIATADHTAFMDERLRECQPAKPVDTTIHPQPPWDTPREKCYDYPVGELDSTAKKSAVTLNWIVGHVNDPATDMSFEVLERLLLGNAASPLRRALVDSKLGEDLSDSGYSNGGMENSFHVGLKGTEPEMAPKIVDLIMNVLKETADQGFSREKVDMAFQQLQYAHREIQSMYPLRLMSWVYNAWIYDIDPLTFLRTGSHLDNLYRAYEADNTIFSKLIRERLLDNPHRLTAIFTPKPGLQLERDRALYAKLGKLKKNFSKKQLKQLVQEAEQLDLAQSTPNSPEALATLPHLHLHDLPPKPKHIPTQITPISDHIELLTTDIFANGVNYTTLAFSLDGLPEELWDYAPLFCYTLTRLGTKQHNFAELSEYIASHSGGITASTFAVSDALTPGKATATITVQGKALDRNFNTMMTIIRELLTDITYQDRDRLKDVLLQLRMRQQSNIISSGHYFAACHASRGISPLTNIDERWGGLPQIRLINTLANDFDARVDELYGKLQRIGKFLLQSPRLLAGFNGSSKQLNLVSDWLNTFKQSASIGQQHDGLSLPAWQPVYGLAEGLAMPSDVSFCSACMPAPHLSSPDSLPLQVAAQLFTYDYLWENIRVKGGAYGAQCAYNPGSGAFSLLSYRDPSIRSTLSVYEEMLGYVEQKEWSTEEIERAVISHAKEGEKPIRPASALSKSLGRHLTRLSDEMRDARRQELLQLDARRIKDVAVSHLRENLSKANICALASQQSLEAASEKLASPLAIEPVIPEQNLKLDKTK